MAAGAGAEQADQYVVCLFKFQAGRAQEAKTFVNDFMRFVTEREGNLHLWSREPASWDVLDGRDHFVEPDHLNPAAFDFNCLVVCGFRTVEHVQLWWRSDEVFELLKVRDSIDKMGVFIVEGLQRSTDLSERNRYHFGDRLVLLELMKMEAFKPMRQYVDRYKRFLETLKISKNLLFADGVLSVLMSEFPLDFAVASSWRSAGLLTDWYESDFYQQQLMPLKQEHARCCSLVVPLFSEERVDDLEKAKKQQAVVDKFTMLAKKSQ